MPVYTYRCESCGLQFDHTQKFSDPPLTECPECGEPVRKVYQPVGIVFKGSGFYATDHRSPSGNGKSRSSENKSPEKGTSDSSSSSESKD